MFLDWKIVEKLLSKWSDSLAINLKNKIFLVLRRGLV
jgi:hypothetical protein